MLQRLLDEDHVLARVSLSDQLKSERERIRLARRLTDGTRRKNIRPQVNPPKLPYANYDAPLLPTEAEIRSDPRYQASFHPPPNSRRNSLSGDHQMDEEAGNDDGKLINDPFN